MRRLLGGLSWALLGSCAGDLGVRVAPVSTIRDLTLIGDVPQGAEIRWTSSTGQEVHGPRVAATMVWPGDTWVMTLESPEGRSQDQITVPTPHGGNVLIVVLDDVGVDAVGAWGAPDAARTPTLDTLAAQGVRFTRAYANPLCSPTRAALLTGRHARRSGLGWVAERDAALPHTTHTLPEALRASRASAPYRSVALGKWHLAGPQAERALDHAQDAGFDHFAGTLGNPTPDGGYDRWMHLEDGRTEVRTGYLTSATIDDAIDEIRRLPEPWMLYVALHAAHEPWTPPPEALLDHPWPTFPTDAEAYRAVVAAADKELGRLLESMPPTQRADTTIIVVGDNGIPGRAAAADRSPDRQKGSLFEGGVHVPLIVTGPVVQAPGREELGLVHVVDLLPTVAEIAGVPLGGPDEALTLATPDVERALDGRSLLPRLEGRNTDWRTYVYAEAFYGGAPGEGRDVDLRMVRTANAKLIRDRGTDTYFVLGDGDRPVDTAAPGNDELRSLMDQLEATLQTTGE